jgi:hypothetical protein
MRKVLARTRREGSRDGMMELKEIWKKEKSKVKAASTLLRSELMTKSDVTLADQIERTGHALTSDELAHILAVSRITIF